MAPRWGGLRPEPYDPDARDADGDGIVQEQTAWERPVGTNLVDELGRAITRGANAGTRPRGMRVVGRDGKDVDYTPTYATPGAAPGASQVGGATALAEHGAGSLKERGLPNVREATAPALPETPEAPNVQISRTSPEVVDRANLPYKLGVNENGSPRTNFYGMQFDAGADNEVDKIIAQIDKHFAEHPDPEREKVIREKLAEAIPDKFNRTRKDELLDQGLADTVAAYEDEPIYVAFPDANAIEVLKTGRMKTLHETGTSQGQNDAEVRRQIELERLGIPLDLPVEKRPVYGWIRPKQRQDGVESEGDLNSRIYGRVHFRLKPDVQSRTTITLGDTIGDKRTGVPLDGKVRDGVVDSYYAAEMATGDRTNALITESRLRGDVARGAIAQTFGDEARSRIQERFLTEIPELEGIIEPQDFSSTGLGANVAHYVEAQVHGGVDIKDVDAIEVADDLPEETLAEIRRLAEPHGIKVGTKKELEAMDKAGSASPDGAPKVQSKGKTPEEIKEKNKSIWKRLRDRGAKVGKVDKEYKDSLQELVDTKQATNFILPATQEEANVRRIERQAELFDGLRSYWETGKRPRYQYEGRLAELGEGRDLLPDLTDEQLDNFPPELKKLIMESTNEELNQRILDAAMLIHGDVRRDQISVQLPASRLDQFLADGKYKTTHEAVSMQSDAGSRTIVEARVMGIPVDAEADVRPASGYVVLGSAIDAAQRDWDERHGDKGDERRSLEFDENGLIEEFGAGGVSSIYGDIRLVMKPEVADRTAYSYGDTIKHQGPGVILMDETDPEVIASVLVNGGDMKRPQLQILNMLESGRRGDTIGFQAGRELHDHEDVANWREGRKFGDPQKFGYRDYMEATILGSFEVGEIDKAYIPQGAVEKQLRADRTPEVLAQVRSEFFSADTLRAKGYSEEEIAYIQGLSDSQLLDLRGGTSIHKILTVRKQKQIKEQFEQQGVTVVFQHAASMDPLDTTSYRQPPGGDVEEYLTGLLDTPDGMYQEVQQDIRGRMQREADRAAGVVPANSGPVM